MVREATINDAYIINKIYNENVSESSVANCHLEKTDEAYWIHTIQDKDSIFVVHVNKSGTISGWGCIKPFSIREEYNGIHEISVYIQSEHQNGIIAVELYKYLMKQAETRRYRQVAALVLSDNKRSLRLLEKGGFVKAMDLPEIAFKNNKMISLKLLTKILY